MFKEVSTRLAFPKLEEQVLDFWQKNDIFRKSVDGRKDYPAFVFLEGPPTANGRPGVHHVLSRIMKDIICRYKTMTGHYVFRKGGWDTHGLPVEIEVEKELGISGKRQIEEYGVREFVEKCKESVFKYEKDWRELTERIAFWVDMDNPYITLTNDYIESLWWVLRQFWDAGLLYQGYKVVPYCPRCGTALSSHEVAQGYRTVTAPSLFVKCKVKSRDNTYFLLWTTTPWTLPSNVALAVGRDYEYVIVEHEGEDLIVAKERLREVFHDRLVEVKETYRGADVLGWEYEPLFDFVKPEKKSHYVVDGDFVTLTEGTGIVHMAPAFGQEDYEMSQKFDLPVVQLVNTEGKFVAGTTWEGEFVKDADPNIVQDLKERGLLFGIEEYEHEYPFCWRCDTPLLYYARGSWFIKTTDFKDKLIEKNNQINWYPEHIKTGRFGDWLENNVDWAISRERYWGTPLNIWVCDECKHQHCVDNAAELKEMGNNVPDDIELHKPYIDEVVLNCPECSGRMTRVPEVIDCWFDSGCAHTAQWHYPFENQELLEGSIPVDYISEAIDQTRGWFYSLLVTGVFLYDKPTYKNCLCLELVLAEDGQKMSKSRGNAVDPWIIINNEGVDAMRWYFYTVTPPWNQRIFSKTAVAESMKKFMGTLYNIYGFLVLYANADDVNPLEHSPPVSERPLMDRWIFSKLNSLTKKVRNELEEYQITSAARAIDGFVDELSNWYVRRSRDRFWGTEVGVDKPVACNTLHQILVGVAKLLAPFTPFIAEEVYQNLVRSLDADAPESVHLCDYPEVDENLIDEQLEADMALVRRLVVMGRAARNSAGVKIRQPLSAITVGVEGDVERESVSRLIDLVVDELNVKEVKYSDDIEEFATFQLKPNFKLLGPKYGKLVQKLAGAVSELDASAAKRELDVSDKLRVKVEDTTVTLTKDEVEVSLENRLGYAVETYGTHFVALSTELSEELILEGFARELVNKIQLMRKEAGFNVSDRIKMSVQSSEIVDNALNVHRDYIMGETLALEVVAEPGADAFVKEWKVNDQMAAISVERLKG